MLVTRRQASSGILAAAAVASAGNARCMKIAVLGATLLAVSFPGHAQTRDIGKREYLNGCAVCHGESGQETD